MEAPYGSVQAGPASDPTRDSRDEAAASPAGAGDREFRRLVERIPAIVYIETDEDAGPTTYISPRIEQVLGYPPEEFLGDRGAWTRLVHPDDLPTVRRIEERSSQTYEPYCAEYRLRARDGRWVWFRDEATFVENEDGGAGYWQGVMIDITEQKEAELRLRELEARQRNLIEQMPAIVYMQLESAPFDSVYMGPRIERLLGHAPEKFEDNKLWEELLHPDDRERALAAESQALATHDPYVSEYRLRALDGRWVWFHDEAAFVPDPVGEGGTWYGVMVDITASKEAEAKLGELEARYRNLVEQLPAATYIDALDERMSPLYVSPQIESLLGIPADVFYEEDLWEAHVHPEDRGRAVRETAEGIASGEPFTLEYRMIRADGAEIWVRDQASTVRDADGNPMYAQGLYLDITDRKRVEEELEAALALEHEAADRAHRANALKDTFLQAVSHDLRSPLAAILGSAVTLAHEEELNLSSEKRAELIQGLVRKSRKLTGLVSDLLDMERLTRQVLEPRLSPVDLGGLVQRVVRESEMLQDRTVHLEAPPIVLAVDDSMVERIVENLLGNAAKHTMADATVWIRVMPAPDGVLIAVEDDGSGVPEGLREALFDPFARGESAAGTPGHGLGLSIVARFAELHGGRAWVEDREGGGASFRVLLPFQPGAA